jgi:phage terminase large subunit
VSDDVVRIKYTPRKAFQRFHGRSTRFACMVAHRRAGKTVASVNEIIHRAIHFNKREVLERDPVGRPVRYGEILKRPRYAYVGPLLKQAKKIAWEYLKEYTDGIQKKKPSESELSVILRHNDAEISVYGADNPDAFRGQYFDGVVLDEYGDMSPSVWGKVLLPTLADRRGWAVFIGTFKGKNHFYSIFRRSQGLDLKPGEDPEYYRRNWFNLILRASESGILSPEDLAIQRAEQDEEEYRQEFECDPNAVVKGTYYAKILAQLEDKGQIYADVDWDPEQPVEVAFDLGYTDSTAAWFWQKRPGGIAIIDYLEAHSQPLSFYFNELFTRPYNYGTVWLPHDARAKSLQTGRSTVEQFLEQKLPVRIAPKLELQHGIDAVRKMLGQCYFSSKTEFGVEALRAYKRDYDDEKKVFSDSPRHDWASHGADAFRYLCLVAKGLVVDEEKKETPRIVVPTPKMQLEILFQERERRLRMMGKRI